MEKKKLLPVLRFFIFFIFLGSTAFISKARRNRLEGFNKTAQAVLKLDKPSYNFGKIKIDKKVKADFEITNSGNLPLIISEVKTTCGCTVPVWSSKPIQPKSKIQLSVYFKPTFLGLVMKRIFITSNASVKLSTVTIKAEVTE